MKIERFAIQPIDIEMEPHSNTLLSRLLLRVMIVLTYWRFIRIMKITPTFKSDKTGMEYPIGKPLYRFFYARIKVLSAP